MRDRILVPAIPLDARVGCTEAERRDPQPILVDIELRCDVGPVAKADAIESAIDYVSVRAHAERVVCERPYALIETIADGVASALLRAFDVEQVTVRVRKPSALAAFDVPWAGVEVVRGRRG